MHTAYLLLGSNLGNKDALLQQAIEKLARLGTITALSQRKETAPWGFTEDVPVFLNQALRLQTSLEPEDLLAACQAIEKELGRDREAEAASAGTGVAASAAQHKAPAAGENGGLGKRTYSSRLIDIDILLYDRLQYRSPTLTVPHPRLPERPFAMALLQEILPKDISLQDFYR